MTPTLVEVECRSHLDGDVLGLLIHTGSTDPSRAYGVEEARRVEDLGPPRFSALGAEANMPFHFSHLDVRTRQLMLDELKRDIQNGSLYFSNRLSGLGRARWPELLERAIESGTERSLAIAVRPLLVEHELRHSRKGNPFMGAVPHNAHEILAEGEFNRFYIRAICRRAIEDGFVEVEVVRAKLVESPRPESERLIGTALDPERLLHDLRLNIGVDTALGVPSGPCSGLSVCFFGRQIA